MGKLILNHSNIDIPMSDVSYGNGIYVAVGSSGIIAYSYDGAYWTLSTSNTTNKLTKVEYINQLNMFIAIGENRTILSSINGIEWSSHITHSSDLNLLSITWDDNTNILVIYGMLKYSPWTNYHYTSKNGVNYTETNLGTSKINSVCDITKFKNIVVSGQYSNTITGHSNYKGGIRTSNSFTTSNWTNRWGNSGQIRKLCIKDNTIYAVGSNSQVAKSLDGVNWIDISLSDIVGNFTSISEYNKELYLTSSNGSIIHLTSDNDWEIEFYNSDYNYSSLNSINNYLYITSNRGIIRASEFKALIKSSNKFYMMSNAGSWIEILLTEPLAKSDFETHGISDLSNISKELWDGLSDFEILMWIDNDKYEIKTKSKNLEIDDNYIGSGKLFRVELGDIVKVNSTEAR